MKTASTESSIDALIRAQVLEGASGLSWKSSQDPFAALRKIEAWSEDNAPGIHPEWFDRDSTTIYDFFTILTDDVLEEMKAEEEIDPQEAFEVALDEIVSGIGRGLGETKSAVRDSGSMASSYILGGRLTPAQFVIKYMKYRFRRKVISQVETIRSKERQKDRAVEKPLDLTRSRTGILIEILLDTSDPLGRKLQEALRQVWRAYPPRAKEYMDFWLAELIRTGEPPGTSAIGRAFGVGDQAVTRTYGRFTQVDLPKFWKKLQLTPLGNALDLRIELELPSNRSSLA